MSLTDYFKLFNLITKARSDVTTDHAIQMSGRSNLS